MSFISKRINRALETRFGNKHPQVMELINENAISHNEEKRAISKKATKVYHQAKARQEKLEAAVAQMREEAADKKDDIKRIGGPALFFAIIYAAGNLLIFSNLPKVESFLSDPVMPGFVIGGAALLIYFALSTYETVANSRLYQEKLSDLEKMAGK
jgi:hypothetical protein